MNDADCGGSLFICDPRTSLCTPTCQTRLDCQERPGGEVLPQCAGALGCWCDQRACVTAQCAADADCGELACRDGACVTPPGPELVDRCSIFPEVAVLKPGGRARFSVLAWDSAGLPVVVKAGATWRALGTTLLGGGQGNEVELEAGSGAQLTAAVEARFGAAHCEARALVLPAPPPGSVGVSAVDALTGRPIAGAKLVFSRPDGSILSQDLETDAAGYAELPLATGPKGVSISVFHPDFSYLTLANLVAPGGVLTLPLERNGLEQVGGIAGPISSLPTTGLVTFGRVGLSRVGEVQRLDPGARPEAYVPVDVGFGSSRRSGMLFASETVYDFAGDQAKARFTTLGQPGTCVRDGLPDEARAAAGTCATRTAWALLANTGLGELPFNLGQEEAVDPIGVLNRLEPRSYFSTVLRDVEYGLRPPPRHPDGRPAPAAATGLSPTAIPFGEVRLGYLLEASLPTLPQANSGAREGTAAVGGAVVPGRGFVPLGFGGPREDNRVVVMRMAPTHHGLEGARYVLTYQRSFWDKGARAVSALVVRPPALGFGDGQPARLDLKARAFLPLPRGLRLDLGPAARSVELEPVTAPATVMRVRLTDGFGSRWDVLVDPAAPRFTWPEVPGALRDRLFFFGNRVVGAASTPTVELLRFDEVGSFAAFAGRDDLHGDRLLERLDAYAFVEAEPVGLTFLTPPGPFTPGSTVRLLVSGVALDREARVALHLEDGSAGCPGDLTVGAERLGPDGLTFPLPPQCTGTPFTLHAALVQPDGGTPYPVPVRASVALDTR